MVRFLVTKFFFIPWVCLFVFCTQTAALTPTQQRISSEQIGTIKYMLLSSQEPTGLAMFFLHGKWYLVWDHPDSEINVPQNVDWPVGISDVEKITTIKSSRPCTILMVNVVSEMIPIITKNDKGWSIHLVSKYLLKEDPNPNQISIDRQKFGHFRILNAGNANFLVIEMPTGEKLNILPTIYPDTGLYPEQSEYLNVYESNQGACLYFKSDKIFIDKQGRDISLFPSNDPLIFSELYTEVIKETPPNQNFVKRGEFTYGLRSFLTQKSVDDPKKKALHLMRRAWVELALVHGDEAKQTAKLIAAEYPDLAKSFTHRMISGFAAFLADDHDYYPESIKILEALPKTPEVRFLIGLCRTQLSEREKFTNIIIPILKNYPNDLRDYILVKLVPHLFDSQQIAILKTINETFSPISGVAKATLDFYHAMYVFTHEYRDDGYKLLEKIAKNQTEYVVPVEFEAEARMETYLYKNADAKLEEIIKELDIIRTQCRGNDVEVKICLKLAHYLEKQKNYVRIIEIFDDLLKRYKKFDISLGFNYMLRDYVDKFFNAENGAVSPVRSIALFRKYKELIESHKNHKKILEWVAGEFERIDLLDQATELLREVLEITSDEKHRIELKIRIGRLYVQNYKPKEATDLLEELYPQADNDKKKDIAQLISKALLLKKEPEKAIKWLERYPSKENRRIIISVCIESKDYDNAIFYLKEYLEYLKPKEDDELKEAALEQLAAAYYVKKETIPLKVLCDTHKEFMTKRKSEKRFNMLCRPGAADLKSSKEVREYITDDAETIKEILKNAESFSDQ